MGDRKPEWWIELETHVSPHHHEHSDGSNRQHLIMIRIPGVTQEDAVRRLEKALQALVSEPAEQAERPT